MKTIKIQRNATQQAKASILIIYTGGTFGMVYHNQSLVPFNFENILKKIPELSQLACELTVIAFDELIDSSNVTALHWLGIAEIIEQNYEEFDGFVVLHGTDTMAYSASALSFMLENLNKPVIFTGAQLPIGAIRNDARRNLITSIEVAAAKEDNIPIVPEVCIFFNDNLLRGNRAKKVQSNYFDAFESANYPPLAQVGTNIIYQKKNIRPFTNHQNLKVQSKFDENVLILQLFPNISLQVVRHLLQAPMLKAVVLESYGSGNAPTSGWFIDCLQEAIEKDIIIYNVSQCIGGSVEQGKYETSEHLAGLGVLSGADITSEAAITKVMYLLAKNLPRNEMIWQLTHPISGEMNN